MLLHISSAIEQVSDQPGSGVVNQEIEVWMMAGLVDSQPLQDFLEILKEKRCYKLISNHLNTRIQTHTSSPCKISLLEAKLLWDSPPGTKK